MDLAIARYFLKSKNTRETVKSRSKYLKAVFQRNKGEILFVRS